VAQGGVQGAARGALGAALNGKAVCSGRACSAALCSVGRWAGYL
jgi:hypothetical protein